ncbi:MAG: PQQ-binding-like beta-propeller repeat protein [Actinobacteria bacterium]|nr:PQQ-binding-like beta-propeller repeat protein [Actinomycetota bacterium]
MRKLFTAAALLALAALSGCGDGSGSSGTVGWPAWGNTARNQRFAALGQINAGNVADLGLAWTRPAGANQFAWETFPIVVGRTMYYDTGTDQVVAVDATSGRVRWSFTPRVDFLGGAVGAYGGEPISRGVTYGEGRIYETTADDRLIALDARSGKRLWAVRVADPSVGSLNSPGTFWDGKIVVGGPAGAAGQRGFVAAYNAADGSSLWRTKMVPPRGSGWRRGPGQGGGDVWMPPTIDPATGTVYVATGNPTPGFSNAARPGCNRMADAVVALDGGSGKVEWSRTLVCQDSWDYDTVQAPLLLGQSGGEDGGAATVGAGSKSGFYAFLEAASGRVTARSPYLTRYSRPHLVPTRAGVVVCPGIYGGLEYGPPAYSPREGLLYVAGNEMCMRYRLAAGAGKVPAGEAALGGTATQVGRASGVVAAIDPETGAVRWRQPLPSTANGGLLATASGLVFVGEDYGWLRAFDAASGRPLWHYRLGLRVGSAPIAYEVDGVEYLAIAAGGSLVRTRGAAPDAPAKLFVFRLGGRG